MKQNNLILMPEEEPAIAMLTQPGLHEIYSARMADAIAATGVMTGLAIMATRARPVLMVRHDALSAEAGWLYPPGIAEFGLDPARLILVMAGDGHAVLQSALEGARTAGLGAVLVDLYGPARAYDLTASRRLAVAARASGLPLFMLRAGAEARASAADTRWLIRALPSRPLAAQAPGNPAFAITLLRARSGQEGLGLHLEWNRDAKRLETRPATTIARPVILAPPGGEAALPRLVVPLPADRPAAPHPHQLPLRATG